MRGRIFIIAVFLGLVSTGVSWLTLQPLLARLLDRLAQSPAGADPGFVRLKAVLPFTLALDVAVASAIIFVLLYVTVGRPLRRAEASIDAISSLEQYVPVAQGGPLASRLDRALKRLAEAAQTERRLNAEQLARLTQANESLGRLQAELVASDRLATVGKLAAGVAHEVGNPLSGILGYLSVLRMRGGEQRDLVEIVDRIEAEVNRIDGIVRALLELGRPSRGKAQPIDVRPIIDSAVRLLSAGHEFRGVAVNVDAPASLHLSAEGGPLSQVLVNLLLNAAQAMAGAGTITVRAEVSGDRGRIVVEDEGPGLSEEARQRLFEPFFTTKAAGQGTGLGLAMSRHLLAQFDGGLEAANRDGPGARFTITLPLP